MSSEKLLGGGGYDQATVQAEPKENPYAAAKAQAEPKENPYAAAKAQAATPAPNTAAIPKATTPAPKTAPAPKPAKDTKDTATRKRDRAAMMIDNFAATLNVAEAGSLYPCLQKMVDGMGPAGNCMWSCFLTVSQAYMAFYAKCYEVYQVLPIDVLQMIFGIALCFFGGTFVVSIAAIEAFRCLGGTKVWENAQLVYREGAKAYDTVSHANLENQYEGSELRRQQLMVAMVQVKNPEHLQNALIFLYTSWVSVLATVQIQFARTIALALGISDCLKLPMTMAFGKVLTLALGSDKKQWVDTIIDTVIKIIAVLFAWQIQVAISAFYTGLRGGRMFAEALIRFLEEKGVLKHFPAFLVPKDVDGDGEVDMESTYLDEILMFPLAALGFWYQLSHGFTFIALPIPIKLILFPLELCEWILEWKVTWG